MGPSLVLDENSVLGEAQAHLAELRKGEKPKFP